MAINTNKGMISSYEAILNYLLNNINTSKYYDKIPLKDRILVEKA